METIQVIRFEHPDDGAGLFYSKYSVQYFDEELTSFIDKHELFPLPQEEGLNLRRGNIAWHCAFKSIDQVKQWVTSEEIAVFKDRGFIIWMLEVSEYQQGEYQVIYTKESIINKTDISSIF